MKPLRRIIILTLVLASCGYGKLPINLKFSDVAVEKTPTEKEYPDAASVILVNEGCVVFDGKGLTYVVHVVRKILNDRGLEYADIKIPYVKSYSDIVDIKARTIRNDGSVVELGKDQFYDVTDFADYIMYAEYKAKKFTMPAVQPGCVIEYLYLKKLKSIHIPAWEFQDDSPTVVSIFTLMVPLSLKYKVLKRKGDIGLDIAEKIGHAGFYTIAQYSAQHIPALRKEPYMPPEDDIVPMLRFTPAEYGWIGEKKPLLGSSWQMIGEWYNDVYAGKISCDKDLKRTVDELTRDRATPREKAKAICEYVRDTYRYVALEIGDGSYVPHEPRKTFENKYGDCKDLSVLTISALSGAGIQAKAGLLMTADNGVMNKTLCSPDVFNHVVVCLPREIIDDPAIATHQMFSDPALNNRWLVFDPTAKRVPFGDLPWQDKGTDVFVLDDQHSDFIATNVGGPEDNAFRSTESIAVFGSTQRRALTLSYTGLEAVRARSELGAGSRQDNDEKIRRKVISLNPGAVVDSIRYGNLADADSVLRIDVFSTIHDDTLAPLPRLIGLTVFDDFSRYNPFTELTRSHDISFPYPRKHEYDFTVSIADPALALRAQDDSLQDTDFPGGQFREHWSCGPSLLTGHSEISISTVWSGKAEYAAWAKLFSLSTRYSQKKILLDRRAPAPPPKPRAAHRRGK